MTSYMDILDTGRKAQNWTIFPKSGSKPVKQIHSEDPNISVQKVVKGLPIELYD